MHGITPKKEGGARVKVMVFPATPGAKVIAVPELALA
jgi:hypothetical protein